jgi:hypothetical protein
MQGRTCLSLALVFTLGLAATAQAQAALIVAPAQPSPADSLFFNLYYQVTPCLPDFAPAPTIAGPVITFHGTFNTEPPTAECKGAFYKAWRLDPLPAGFYTAKVEVSGLTVASVDFTVGTPPTSVVPLLVKPDHPTTSSLLQIFISGIATSSCPPSFDPPVFDSSTRVLRIAGRTPAFPVTPSCQGFWIREIDFPALPAGTYTIAVEINFESYASQTLLVDATFVPPAVLTVDPQLPTTSDRITVTGILGFSCPTTFGPPVLRGNRIVLPATFGPLSSCPTQPNGGKLGTATIGPLPPGAYLVELETNGLSDETQGITVTAPTTALPLVGGRFEVTLDRSGPAPGGPALAVPLTDQSGYFWFFSPQNIEVTVKILDGRAVDGHYWLFAASMTDVPFTLKVKDLGSPLCGTDGTGCPVKTYTARQGVNENFIDLGSL